MVAAVIAMAFLLEGLATAHDLTRPVVVRRLLLGSLYFVMLVYPPWPLLAVAVLGCVDCLFPLRRYLHPPVPKLRS